MGVPQGQRLRRHTAFGSFGCGFFGSFWLAYTTYAMFVAGTLPVSTAHQATGLFLSAWAIFTVYMTVAATRTTGAVLAVFVTGPTPTARPASPTPPASAPSCRSSRTSAST